MRSPDEGVRAFDLEGVSGASKRMGLSARTVYRMIRRNQLTGYQVGGRIMVHRWEVDAYIAERKAS